MKNKRNQISSKEHEDIDGGFTKVQATARRLSGHVIPTGFKVSMISPESYKLYNPKKSLSISFCIDSIQKRYINMNGFNSLRTLNKNICP
ncbi:hypothetical protein [Methanosarcina sp. MSH10X1]|uniref:hypothetical protein n=1 Tax=Methanosarcina sp. MSH10X1 TaxID=2507075 RepID=UPI001F0B8DE5|nr:hypothetical protein [Methanosarcina sp. MSH10X1]